MDINSFWNGIKSLGDSCCGTIGLVLLLMGIVIFLWIRKKKKIITKDLLNDDDGYLSLFAPIIISFLIVATIYRYWFVFKTDCIDGFFSSGFYNCIIIFCICVLKK